MPVHGRVRLQLRRRGPSATGASEAEQRPRSVPAQRSAARPWSSSRASFLAEVKTQGSSSLGQVIIKHNATTVIAVKQRDLFSKYRWPAAPKILERLEMLKEDLED